MQQDPKGPGAPKPLFQLSPSTGKTVSPLTNTHTALCTPADYRTPRGRAEKQGKSLGQSLIAGEHIIYHAIRTLSKSEQRHC